MWRLSTLDASKPIYLGVVDAIESDIRAGKLQPGQRMPTHRELAKTVGVTIGTASRVYHEAEKRGLVTAVVGRGTFVTVDAGTRHSVIDVSRDALDWDLGIARPLTGADPDVGAVVRKVLNRRRLPDLMLYPDPQGLPEHRSAGADWLNRFGLRVPPKDVVITAGTQHALSLICNSLMSAGDHIVTDCLTHMGLKAAAQRNGIRLKGVRMDSAGMLPDELDALCNRQAFKALYLSGRIQNPTNREMPHARRLELRDVIRKHGLTLIENDAYGFLSQTPDRNLTSLLPDRSIYISSLSKAFSAGLRIAYVAAPTHITQQLSQGIADTMLFVSPVCAEIASECLRSGLAEASIRKKRELVRKRVALFRDIFTDHVFESLDECLFVWLKLPCFRKAASLEADAAERGIRVMSSMRFAIGASPPVEAVRIALTGVERLTELRKALHALERLISKTA